MTDRAHSAHWYPELVMATVTGVHTTDPNVSQFRIDAQPVDGHQVIVQIPWMNQPGIARRPRKGMQVGILYVKGSPRAGIAIGHTFNLDTIPRVADPVPLNRDMSPVFVYDDDLAMYHDETKSFIRFRNLSSTTNSTGPDGSPGLIEVTMQSGASLQIEEYAPDGAPPAPGPTPPLGVAQPPPPVPTRAKLTLNMPAGTFIAYDEPETGQATLAINMPSNASMTIDQYGNFTFMVPSGAKFTVVAPDDASIDLGGGSVSSLAYKSDVEALRETFNAHTHPTAATGPPSVPSTPAAAPVGTSITFAQ